MRKSTEYQINWRTSLKGKSGRMKNSAQKVLRMYRFPKNKT